MNLDGLQNSRLNAFKIYDVSKEGKENRNCPFGCRFILFHSKVRAAFLKSKNRYTGISDNIYPAEAMEFTEFMENYVKNV